MSRERDQERLLYGATSWQQRAEQTARPIGELSRTWLAQRVRQFEQNASVVDVWRELLPPAFYEHCGLAEVNHRTVYVEADPGPWMHELQIMRAELLEHMQQRCGRNRVKKIIIRPRRANPVE